MPTDQPTPADLLAADVERLEIAYGRAHQALTRDLLAQGAWHSPQTIPEDLRDGNGRFILLDALTGLVNGRAAIANAARTTTGTVAGLDVGLLLEALDTLEGLPDGGRNVMRWARRKLGHTAPVQHVVITAYQQAMRTLTLEPPVYSRSRAAALAEQPDLPDLVSTRDTPLDPRPAPVPPRDQP
ncbi:hypothetical protein [Nonomuraea basaltis]|uniref:hypothetical protein n=1 Tax=Nonomuraea basaltis TaxID=2495887 RepID=UPI00110C6DA9|nr:hypothetical protein [Nonomuraea basaltis]TMR92582.1 hypothetical protein EJK15_44070 [Nonomuraea basaltis]